MKVDSHYVIRTLFATQTGSGFSKTILHYTNGSNKRKWQLQTLQHSPVNTRTWRHEQVGSITFIFDETHRFNADLAERMNAFVDSLAGL